MALAGIVLLEGLAIAANAHPMSVEGFGGLKASTVMLAGLQLAAIGGVMLFALWWSERPRRKGMVDRIVALLPLLGGVVVLVEGLIVAYLAAPIVIRDVGSVQSFYISAFAAQLFLLGAGLVTLWLFRARCNIGLLVSLGAFLLLSSAGVLAASMAEPISWAGLGGFRSSTVLAAGILVMAVGLIGIMLHYVGNWKLLGRSLLGMEVSTWALLGLGAMVALAGAVIISFAGPVIIHGLTSFKGSTVALAGLGVFALGLLSILPMLFRKDVAYKRWIAVRACLFALLLLPFAAFV